MFQYETNRLLLQTKTESDFLSILQFYEENKSHLEPFEETRPENFYTPEYQLKMLSMESQLTKSHNYLRLWLSLKEDPNTIIGTICFSDIFRHCAYLGYKIDYRYTGNGYCYEACVKGMEIMKNEYHVNCIKASILPDNLASFHVLKKLGFTFQRMQLHPTSINHHFYYLHDYQKLLG